MRQGVDCKPQLENLEDDATAHLPRIPHPDAVGTLVRQVRTLLCLSYQTLH